jgi:DNA-binding MarR family transcriptional regulator
MTTGPFQLADFLPYRLSVASNAVSRAVATGAGYESRFGLSNAEWRVLAVVTAAGNPAQAALIEATGMDKMTISRAVTGLAHRRLIDRVRDSGDRRTLRLAVTAEGRRIHDIVIPEARKVEARLLAALSPAEAETLRAALAKLHKACDEP